MSKILASTILKNYFARATRTHKGILTDFKKYGFWVIAKRLFYDREAWWDKGNKIFVGQDEFGNKYWETTEPIEHGRERWVEYAKKRGSVFDASDVPAEWHMWLHRIRDKVPTKEELESKGRVVKTHFFPNRTGEPGRYYPPGHFFNPHHHNPNPYSVSEVFDPTKTKIEYNDEPVLTPEPI